MLFFFDFLPCVGALCGKSKSALLVFPPSRQAGDTMTDEYSYYGQLDTEPDETADHWLHEATTEINLSESHFCVLTRHGMLRVCRTVEGLRPGRRESGLRHLAVLAVIKQYGDCFASLWTIARKSGCRDIETLESYIEDLLRVAAVERVIVRHRAWMERWVASRETCGACAAGRCGSAVRGGAGAG
jgi:hypothetical protein